MTTLERALRLAKFEALASGAALTVSARDRIDVERRGRKLTPADYASTTGIILCLENRVWVNAPIIDERLPDVVVPILDYVNGQFWLTSDQHPYRAAIWLPPAYHDTYLRSGRPVNHFVYTHADRVRLSPLRGCSMQCKFCNIPYEEPYDLKPIDEMIEALELAFADPLQPAHHALISGGTPTRRDHKFLQEVYAAVLTSFPNYDIDIMMVPVPGLLDVRELMRLGVHELSINLELVSDAASRHLMPQKHRLGLDVGLEFIRAAARLLGPGRVRSMLMIGLESIDESLQGVRRILDAGGVPVLSPFRPSPSTPLHDHPTLSADELAHVYECAEELCASYGTTLGPRCAPCTHNTLSFADSENPVYPLPVLVS